jgi:hypothetical protein
MNPTPSVNSLCLKWGTRYPATASYVNPKPSPGCKIFVFHGRPDPDEAIPGFRDSKLHHLMRPAPWIGDHWKL